MREKTWISPTAEVLSTGVSKCNTQPISPVDCRKKQLKNKLPEITIFLWNVVLDNIYFTTIAEKSKHFFNKITPHLAD